MTGQLRPALAELLGSFLLCLGASCAILTDSLTRGGIGWLGIALSTGMILSIVTTAFFPVSGAHLNPALTLSLRWAGRIDGRTASMYLVAQLIGTSLAGIALRLVFEKALWQPVSLGTPLLAPGLTPLEALTLEALFTGLLLFAYLGTLADSRAPKLGGWGVGMSYAAGLLIIGPLTGGALNPARVFGTALTSGVWEYHWVYWAGPVLGALSASQLYTRVLSKTI